MVLHFLCVSKKECKRKAKGNSVPSCFWDNCTPQESSDALVYTMYLLLGVGYDSISACKLRNHVKVSKQIGRQASQLKLPTDKLDNIHHQDDLDQMIVQAIIMLKDIRV